MIASTRRSCAVCCAGVLLGLAVSTTAVADPSARFSVSLRAVGNTNVGSLAPTGSESAVFASNWQGTRDRDYDSDLVLTSASAAVDIASASARTEELYVYADANATAAPQAGSYVSYAGNLPP
jgi:hypothetical protein